MGKSVADLANELEYGVRTIYRDFEALQVAGTNEIKFWVMSWESKAEVLAPEIVRDEIPAEEEAMLGRYSRDVDQIEGSLQLE